HQDGVLSGYNALDVLTWVDPVTWLFQVMPIFFLVGGYASSASMASHRRGGDGIGWVLRRTDRLLRPTTALFLVLPAVTVVTVAGGWTGSNSVTRSGLPPCRCGSCCRTSSWWCSRRGCTGCTAGWGWPSRRCWWCLSQSPTCCGGAWTCRSSVRALTCLLVGTSAKSSPNSASPRAANSTRSSPTPKSTTPSTTALDRDHCC